MFVINDMELLARLGKHNILSGILARHSIFISSIKLNEYGLTLKKQIQLHARLSIGHTDDGFDGWIDGKRRVASLGDLSSLYLAKTEGIAIVFSNEDTHLEVIARAGKVVSLNFDEFIRRTVNDQRMVQIYHLIKAA
jgi:hypothetical protein